MTRTDRGGSRWGINDEVVQLREWGAQRMHMLPAPKAAATPRASLSVSATLGASPTCTFRVDDPGVSREHLRLSYIDGRWLGVDLDSKNGTRVDGVRARMFSLTPGCEIRTGGVTMLAESRRSIQLRRFLCRILGWAEERTEAVDLALRSIRHAALGRGALYLSGAGDLVQVAGSLHRHVWGAGGPFVMCDPRRADTDESVRSMANKPTGLQAFAAACRGTLCVRARRPPRDLADVLRQLDRPGPRVLLVIVDAEPGLRYAADVTTNPAIRIPPLAQRTGEIPAVIDDYITDATDNLSLPRSLFADEDRIWVLEHAATSLPEIEKATQRLLALRGSRNLSAAAKRLRMAPVSLTRWFGRRTLPESLALKLLAADA